MEILGERSHSFTASDVREIEGKLAFVAECSQPEMAKPETSSNIEKNYELPDGQVITIGNKYYLNHY